MTVVHFVLIAFLSVTNLAWSHKQGLDNLLNHLYSYKIYCAATVYIHVPFVKLYAYYACICNAATVSAYIMMMYYCNAVIMLVIIFNDYANNRQPAIDIK